MAMTLTQAGYLSNDILQKGVIELIVKDDPVFERLPFVDILGNGLTYNVRTTESTAAYYDVGDTWTESTSATTTDTALTKILGGDADVDRFLQVTRSNINDLMADQIAAKSKAVKETFLESMVYGYNTGNTKEFNGLHYLIRSSTATYDNTVATATSSGTSILLKLERLEKGVDLCRNGTPDIILMSKLMRRSINKYLKGVGGITSAEVQGKIVQTIYDVPIFATDYIRNNESADLQYGTDEAAAAVYGHNYADADGTDNDGGTSIFCLKFGAPYNLVGIQSGGTVQVERLGSLETKDAERVRIKWYCGIMLQSIVSCSKVTGIDADGTVAA